MRDIILTAFFFTAIPFCIARADFAIALWYWASLFQPQTQSYGFATAIPFSAIAGSIFFLALLFRRGQKIPEMTALVTLVIVLGVWTTLTTIKAVSPGVAYEKWAEFTKLLLMVVFGIAVIRARKDVDLLCWAICISLGYYGFKVGLFALFGGSGANYRGPSYMFGNNEIARGILMSLPVLIYLFAYAQNIWIRAALLMVSISSAIGLVMSGSRGAWFAAMAMASFTAISIRHGLRWLFATLLAAVALAPFLPATIINRFLSIANYQNDLSVQGRFDSWAFALEKFKDRPFMGGGFGVFEFEHGTASHNSFFQALGEHGAVGLLLYVFILLATLWTTITTRKSAVNQPELEWAASLARALLISTIGYIVGSISISFAFFPGFYALIGVVAALQIVVKNNLPGSDDHVVASIAKRRDAGFS